MKRDHQPTVQFSILGGLNEPERGSKIRLKYPLPLSDKKNFVVFHLWLIRLILLTLLFSYHLLKLENLFYNFQILIKSIFKKIYQGIFYLPDLT